jgi:hypothetical protein
VETRRAFAGSGTACVSPVSLDEVLEVDALAARYLAGRRLLFDRRITECRALDGHGDLLADDIFLLDDGPRVLDCVEFDDRLRWGDALADVAFLAMDMERLARQDLAERFLAAYREHAGDTWPASLAHHHIAYRAQVRAKVGAIRAAQGDDPAVAEARRLLALSRRHLEAGAVRLVLVGGYPALGSPRSPPASPPSLGRRSFAAMSCGKSLRASGPTSLHRPPSARASTTRRRPLLPTPRYCIARRWPSRWVSPWCSTPRGRPNGTAPLPARLPAAP